VWYFRQSISFPLVRQPRWYEGELAYTSLDALAPGKDANLDRICAAVMGEAPLHASPERISGDIAAELGAIERRIAPYCRERSD